MSDPEQPLNATILISEPAPARSRADEEREFKHTQDYHGAILPEVTAEITSSTFKALFGKYDMRYTDKHGNTATANYDSSAEFRNSRLQCKDGTVLSGATARQAIESVHYSPIVDNGFYTDIHKTPSGSPLETACRAEHNRREHKGQKR